MEALDDNLANLIDSLVHRTDALICDCRQNGTDFNDFDFILVDDTSARFFAFVLRDILRAKYGISLKMVYLPSSAYKQAWLWWLLRRRRETQYLKRILTYLSTINPTQKPVTKRALIVTELIVSGRTVRRLGKLVGKFEKAYDVLTLHNRNLGNYRLAYALGEAFYLSGVVSHSGLPVKRDANNTLALEARRHARRRVQSLLSKTEIP